MEFTRDAPMRLMTPTRIILVGDEVNKTPARSISRGFLLFVKLYEENNFCQPGVKAPFRSSRTDGPRKPVMGSTVNCFEADDSCTVCQLCSAGA